MIKNKFLNLMVKYSDNKKFILNCWSEIEQRYSARSRYYHTLEHIENMLAELAKIESAIGDKDTLLFSIYYHDIIYEPTKDDNEHQSALFFLERISQTSFIDLHVCIAQIEKTKTHTLSTDQDTNFLLDLDLSILGKSPEEYQNYSKNIRNEYQMYPDLIYRNERRKALQNFLKMESIYKTEFFKREYEAQALKNIKREMAQMV